MVIYAYNRIRKRAPAYTFGPRNALTLNHLPVLFSQFKLGFYMTDA
ncbi:hypothetical protein EWM58_00695 [Candidatus Erwinia dacicola]|nr:hypothetical protein [Candidatus Erwinia dacicola]